MDNFSFLFFIFVHTLWQKLCFVLDHLLNGLNLGSNILLELHGVRNAILRGHLVRLVLDLVQVDVSLLHPGVNKFEGLVKILQPVAEVFDLLDLLVEPVDDFELLLDSLDLLLDEVLLVFWQSHGHDIVVALNVSKHTLDGVLAVVKELLSEFKIFQSALEVEPFLHLLDLLLSFLILVGNVLQTGSVTQPGVLGVVDQLETGLGLLLGVLPPVDDALDVAVEELGFANVIKKKKMQIKNL